MDQKKIDLWKQRRNQVHPTLRKMMAGGIAGIITKTSTAPLERIKILLQIQGMAPTRQPETVAVKAPKYRNIFHAGLVVVKQDGPLALWRGNFANCLRVFPVYALKFAFNDFFRDLVRKPGQRDVDLTKVQLMTCGSMAGLFQQTITFPLEFVRTRLSLQEGSGSGLKYKGVLDCFRQSVRQEGFLSVYKGLGPTIVSGAPYVGMQMTFYTLWKEFLATRIGGDSLVTTLGSGALAGLCAQMVTYPGDTVRRRMIANGTGGGELAYSSSIDCCKKIFATDGVRGFFKGATANVVRCIPGAAIQFYAYDSFKSFFGSP